MHPQRLLQMKRRPGRFLLAFFLPVLSIFLSVHGGQARLLSNARNARALSESPPRKAPSALWPHERSDLAPDPAVHFARLENGFRYVLMKNRKPKGRVSMHLDVQVGSAHEDDDEQGIAHFLEHMVFNGSTHYPPGELVKYFQRIGMQFGPDANAHTSYFETVYDILLPKADVKSIDEALVIFKDFAQGALLLESEIDRERGVVLAEKRERDSAAYRTYVKVMKFEFQDSLLSRRFPIGKEEVLLKLNREKVKRFYDRWYRPDKMILVMVGDFDIQSVASRIDRRFEDLRVRGAIRSDPELGKIRHQGIKPFYHFEAESGGTEVSIEVIKQVPRRPDTEALKVAAWKREVANRIVQDRLDAVLAAPDPPFSSASISSGLFLSRIEYAQISAECQPDQWERALAVLEQTLRQALEFGFSTSEVRRVKREIAAEMDRAVRGAATRNSRHLARKLIAGLNNGRVFRSPRQEKALFEAAAPGLTPEGVHEAFKAAWKANHRLVLVTGNADLSESGGAAEARIRRAFEQSQEVVVKRPESPKTVRFPYLPEPKQTGKILQKKEIPDLGILQVDFENGLRLNLKRTDFAANTVQATLAFGFGRSAEPENRPGLGIFTEALINESGVGRLNRHELDQALADKNTSVFFRVAEGHFALKGTTVTKEVRLMFQLMRSYLLDPAYRREASRLVMERFRQVYAEMDHSVETARRLLGPRFLAGDDGRFGYPPPEAFRHLSLADARDWLSVFLKKARLELSVVGDMDRDAVLALASRYFGSLPARPGLVRPRPVSGIRFPAGKTRIFPVDTKIPKALVVLAYPTEDLWNIRRTRRLNILGEVLSERLREGIREKQGAAYSPVAYHQPSRTYTGYGVLFAMVYTTPGTVNRLISEIQAIAATLARSKITVEELQRTVGPVKTSIKDMRRRNGYWLNTVLTGSREHPEQLEWSRTLLSDYAAISPEQISRLAGTYLRNNRAAIMVFKPKKPL